MWIEQDLVTVSEYATKRNVPRPKVYAAISSNRIELTIIGINKHAFIDWKKYKDIPLKGVYGGEPIPKPVKKVVTITEMKAKLKRTPRAKKVKT